MIELPEAAVLAKQINETISGQKIRRIVAAHTPHKFAWYAGDPQKYPDLLKGRVIGQARSFGGLVEIQAEDTLICLSDGANLRYYRQGEKLPDKHQLYIEFENGSAFTGTVQMYGGFLVFPAETKVDNKYYLIAKAKPAPLATAFDPAYFASLFDENTDKLSLKAFLATEQRIPGLGNGVLQDILFNAKMHPKKKVNSLSEADKQDLFASVKTILAKMVSRGGRDTEKDLFNNPGGYITVLSKNTAQKPCPVCRQEIIKEAYLGGSVYYCANCQRK